MFDDHDPVFPGPAALGRGAVIAPDADPPPPLAGAPRVRVDDAALERPERLVDDLHRWWVVRRPFVVELAVPVADLRRPEIAAIAPEEAGHAFEFARERLQFLTWANNYDLRSGRAIWWLARKATRLGLAAQGPADVLLPNGRPAWCDGGPRGPVDVAEAIVHRESIDLGEARWHYGAAHPLDDLAADQMAAVVHPAGPARIIAPAGSGKTRTLTARLRHLLVDRGIETTAVLALAYNARAASEMQVRLDGLPAHIRTIHSLGNWIVTAGRGAQRLATEAEMRDLLTRLAPVRPRPNQDVLAPYLEALAEVRIGLRTPADVEKDRDDVPDFAAVFTAYRAELAERSMIDFDEQIYGAIELLLRDPDLRASFQARARHLLVDEFQDLTPGYLLLLRLVAAPGYQVFGVGDDDQVIYGYAGADPGFLIDFDTLFPGAVHYALETNYRSSPEIVAAAVNLLAHNRRRIAKTISAAPDREPDPASVRIDEVPFDDLATTAADTVARWIADGAEPAGIAVLARVNDALLPVQLALEDAAVPYRSTVDTRFLRRSAVRAALAYLRIGLEPEAIGRADLSEVIRRPSRRLGRRIRDGLSRRPRWSLDALAGLAGSFDDPERGRITALVADLEAVADAVAGGDVRRALQVVRHTVGLERAARLLDGSRSAADRSAHTDDLDALEQAAALNPDPATFEAWLEDVLRRPGSDDGVILSTVHRVKGMEWPRVIVFRADRGLMPHRLSPDVEEERRVFHVAVTRAASASVVLADRQRPSPFLDEVRGTAPVAVPTPRPEADRVAAADRVAVAADMRLTAGGYGGTVREVHPGWIILELDEGGALMTVDNGEWVTAGARSGPLDTSARPQEPEVVPDDPEVEARFEALRAWRLERSRRDGVPAFVVLNDEHLRGVAARLPRTAEDLLACPGIGPTKLDRYGDELLEVLDGLAGDAPSPETT
jgi:DNA helicase II / ATP-dependent DNA helicase PcrA